MLATWQSAVDTYGLPTLAGAVAAVVLLVVAALFAARRRHGKPASRAVHPEDGGAPPRADLRRGLAKTRAGVWQRLLPLLGRGKLDAQVLEELETALLAADVGVRTTQRLLGRLQEARTGDEVPLTRRLEEEIVTILQVPSPAPCPLESPGDRPHVIMVVGVNGVGKTTSIGKLAARFVRGGKRTMLVAADTFRAAAIEQLAVWADRSGAELVRQQLGGDPGAVAYDGMRAAVARKVDVVMVDTAGRLHTKSNLMEELRKVRRVIGREVPGAPHETLLVVDAVTGQNGLAQARAFLEHLEVTGIVLTKLDGTARGGIVLAIAGELHVPIRFVGVGEGVEDLREFDPRAFAAALLAPSEAGGMA